MYYLDVNFYRYFIGRDDQSVNEKVMIKRIDQQIRVNKLMTDIFHNCQFDNKYREEIYVELSGYHHDSFFHYAGACRYTGSA